MKKMHVPRIRIGTDFILLLAFAYATGRIRLFFLAFAAALFHEAAHVITLYVCGGRVQSVQVSAFGASMQLQRYPFLGYKREMLVAAAGPIAGFGAAFFCSALGNTTGSEVLFLFAGFHFLLSLINLIPAYPLDGGRIVSIAVSLCWGEHTAGNVRKILCALSAFVVLTGCVVCNLICGFQLGLTLFTVFLLLSFVKNLVPPLKRA